MKAKDAIKMIQKLHPETELFVGCEGFYAELTDIKEIEDGKKVVLMDDCGIEELGIY